MMQFSKQSHVYTHMHGVLRLFRIKWHFILDCMSIVVFFSVRSPFHFFFVSWHRCFLNVFFTNRKIAIVTIEWKSYERKLFILFVHRFAYVHIWIHSSTKSWILFDLATDNEFFFLKWNIPWATKQYNNLFDYVYKMLHIIFPFTFKNVWCIIYMGATTHKSLIYMKCESE